MNPAQCQKCGTKLPTQSFGGLCHRCAGHRLLAATVKVNAVEPPSVPTEGVGHTLGHYKLLEQIGEGGFGVVYIADQSEPVRRRVALKILKPGMDTRQVVARFEAERQALAMMDHPNVAKVFDAGTTAGGRPYFVMELVRGIRITDFCDQANLSTQERLNLFIQVCQAIQHAHQKGIIHRDIKPSNILVALQDGVAVPKVIDFGIAKAIPQLRDRLTDATVYTQLNQFIGTPAYMSPEQAEMSALDIDTRSDIYSLGVLLYELLSGRTPFDSRELLQSGIEAMRKTIREQEPERPSTKLSAMNAEELSTTAKRRAVETAKLIHQVRGDLDWVVMKCLEKDRARRYETANGLAADLRRHLNDEPVTAGPPSTAYRFQKFVRRNRGPVIVAALVSVVLVLGMVGTTWGLIEARRQETAARMRLVQVEKANDILGSIFENLNPRQMADAKRPLQDILLTKLDEAVAQLRGESVGDSLAVAALQNKFGRSLSALGDPNKAILMLEASRTTRETKLGPEHPDTLSSMNNLAGAYMDAGKLDLSIALLETTLRLREATLGLNHTSTLDSLNSLAVANWHAKRLDKSIPLFEETRRREEATFGRGHLDYAMVVESLGQNYLDAGRTAEALPMLEEALARIQARVGRDHPIAINAMASLAGAYQRVGKLDLALPLMEETLKLQRAKLGPDHPETLLAMGNLASGYGGAGKLDQALSLSEETLKLRTVKLGPDHPWTLAAMNNLAEVYWHAHQLDKSIALYQDATQRMEAKLGPDHSDTLNSQHAFVQAYMAAGKLDLARPLLEKTLQRMKTKFGPDDSTTLQTMGTLAGLYQTQGESARCLSLLEEALERTRAKLGPDNPGTIAAMSDLAEANQIAGKRDAALPLFEAAMKLTRTQLARDDPGTVRALRNLGGAYQAAGKLDLALPLLEEALPLLIVKQGADGADTLALMSKLAPMYWRVGQLDKSIPMFEDLLPRVTAKFGRDHPNTVITVANLGVNYRDAGRLKDALPLLEEAHRAAAKYPQFRWVGSDLLMAYQQAGESAKAIPLLHEALEKARDTLPVGSPELAGVLAQTSMALLRERQYAEAEPLIRECLAIRNQALPDNWATFNTKSLLGGALLGQKKYTDAESWLLEGYRGMKEREPSIPPPGRPRLPEALKRIVQFYEAVGKESEASAWRLQMKLEPSQK